MSATRFTYQRLVELVEGDHDLIAHLLEEGIIEQREDDRVLVDVDLVLVARTLSRDLAIEWSGIDVILRMREHLARARARIAELERLLAAEAGQKSDPE